MADKDLRTNKEVIYIHQSFTYLKRSLMLNRRKGRTLVVNLNIMRGSRGILGNKMAAEYDQLFYFVIFFLSIILAWHFVKAMKEWISSLSEERTTKWVCPYHGPAEHVKKE